MPYVTVIDQVLSRRCLCRQPPSNPRQRQLDGAFPNTTEGSAADNLDSWLSQVPVPSSTSSASHGLRGKTDSWG